MKKIYKKEEGVSPVIATILMVAITVVLAATVWLLVSGYMGGSTQTPLTMGLTYNAQESNATKAVFDVSMSHPSQTDPSKVTVKIGSDSTTGGIPNSKPSNPNVGSSYYAYYNDINGNGVLDTGDQLIIESDSAFSGGPITVYVSITGYSGHATATIPT